MSRIKDAQRILIHKHGVDRYPTMPEKLAKLMEEVGELAAAWNKNKPLPEAMKEAADVVLTVTNIADVCWGMDIEDLVMQVVAEDDRNFAGG